MMKKGIKEMRKPMDNVSTQKAIGNFAKESAA
jgi:hypothetical protein